MPAELDIRLIVGLGNPGREYETTRHNAGFWFAERLARKLGASFNRDAKFSAEVAKVQVSGREIWLLKPLTFMNVSGKSVGSLAKFFKIEPAEILVAHDELDLPTGSAKLKFGGGTGGHNGLKDIAAVTGTQDFWRLRLGIDHPRERGMQQDVADYVLHRPSKDDQVAIDDAIDRSLEIWSDIATGSMKTAMLKLHTKKENGE